MSEIHRWNQAYMDSLPEQININLDFYENAQEEQEEYFLVWSKDLDSKLRRRLQNEYFSCGPLDDLILDTSITEICTSASLEIYYEKNSKWQLHDDQFLSQVNYQNFIFRLCKELNIDLNLKNSFHSIDWRGMRLHLAHSSLTDSGFLLNLRKPIQKQWSLEILQEKGSINEKQHQLLQEIIDTKKNFFVIGPTGSGKTSFLNACIASIQSCERLILLEDTSELIKPNSLSCKLLTAENEIQKYDLGELLRQSLRMRPDRLVLGEVRGAEAKDLLMAFATGHKGCMGSLHAENAQEALLRLEMLIQLGAPDWSLESIRRLIHLSLDYIISVEKDEKGMRKVKSIDQICSLEAQGIVVENALADLSPSI